MKTIVLFAFVLAAAAPMSAQSASGMAAMQYYVGSWSCTGAMTGQPSFHATATFTLDNGILRQWVSVPPFGKMKQAYYLTFAASYDPKHQRYLQTSLDNLGGWTTSSAKPFTGNTEHWTDTASSDPKLGWGETVRVDQNTYTYSGYASMSSKTPNFKVTCTRNS
jgi:hypothetical protein